MVNIIQKIEEQFKKASVVDVQSGDTVRVHQKIKEGAKERVQIFQGLVIRTDRKESHTSRITVRRISGGIGVEKSFLLHSPLVLKIEVTKRSKVRRNYLVYMRGRTGKSARMTGVAFDRDAVNAVRDKEAEAEEAKLHDQAAQVAETEAAKETEKEAAKEAKVKAAMAQHEATNAEAEAKDAQSDKPADADKTAPKVGDSEVK